MKKECENCGYVPKTNAKSFCPECGKQLVIKKNAYALWAFILSLIFPLGYVMYGFSYFFFNFSDLIRELGLFITLIGYIATAVSFGLYCAAISYSKICIKKYKVISYLTVVIIIVTYSALFIPRIFKSVNEDNCGNTWCSQLNTTITMNWSQESQP